MNFLVLVGMTIFLSSAKAELSDTPWAFDAEVIVDVSDGKDIPDGSENRMVRQLKLKVYDCPDYKVVQHYGSKGLELLHVFPSAHRNVKKFPSCDTIVEKEYSLYPASLNCAKDFTQKSKDITQIVDAKNVFTVTYYSQCAKGPIMPEHSADPYPKITSVKIVKRKK